MGYCGRECSNDGVGVLQNGERKAGDDQETVLLFISVGSRRFEFEAVLHRCPLAELAPK
jgi:hypothetical protein